MFSKRQHRLKKRYIYICIVYGLDLHEFSVVQSGQRAPALCMGGHMYASCWGLRCFLCSTLVICLLFHFYIISNVRKLLKNIRFFLITNKNLKSLPFLHLISLTTKVYFKGFKSSWFKVFKLVDFDPFGVFLCFNEGSLFLNFNFRVFSSVIFFQIPKLKFKDFDNASPLLP